MSQPAFEWASKARKILTITQVLSASISLFASLTMAIFIAWPKNGGMKSPYRRIIFGLSISDVFQSFALVSGPWSVPSWTEISWARGNDASCKVNGVLLTFGQTAVPMYTCFICLYYLCKLKYRMADKEFKRKIEWKVHTFIVFYSIIVAGSALFLRVYHTGVSWSVCHFATTPLGCRSSPEDNGECDATITFRVDMYILVNVFILSFISLSAITVMMVMLYKHANLMKNIATAGNPSQRNQTQITNNEGESGDIRSTGEQEDTAQMVQNDEISIVYQRQVMIQATCYVGAFVITYVPVIISFFILLMTDITSSILNRVLFHIAVLIYPIGGLFNILIYARPKVVVLQRNHPECSKLKGLWLVLRAGGEIPDEVDELVFNKCCPFLSCDKIKFAFCRFCWNLHPKARKFDNHNEGCPIPNLRNNNSEFDQYKFEGDSGFIEEEDWSYEEDEPSLDQFEAALGNSELSSHLSFSRGDDDFDSSKFSLSTE